MGRTDQLEPPDDGRLWAAADPAPRSGCQLDVLIDGAQALPKIPETLAGARSHVHIAGWHITPSFGLNGYRCHPARHLSHVVNEALLAKLRESG